MKDAGLESRSKTEGEDVCLIPEPRLLADPGVFSEELDELDLILEGVLDCCVVNFCGATLVLPDGVVLEVAGKEEVDGDDAVVIVDFDNLLPGD